MNQYLMNRREDEEVFDRRGLQVGLNKFLRLWLGYWTEGDFCSNMQSELGSSFLRGQEMAHVDAALLATVNGEVKSVSGLEVKSLVLTLRDGDVNGKSPPYWFSVIISNDIQKKAGMYCIGFPLLRCRGTIALDPDLVDLMVPKPQVAFLFSAAGHQIENIVPPAFWPKMYSQVDTRTALRWVQSKLSEPEENAPPPTC